LLKVVEDVLEGVGDDALGHAVDLGEDAHCVRFAGAGLTIDEVGAVEALQNVVNQWLG